MTLDGIGIEPFAVLEAASESILVTDADLERPGPLIVYANPAFQRMTGWTAREVIGKSPRILQGASTDLSIFPGMREALKSGHRWEGQTVNYRKNGSQFVMEWSITPLRDKAGRITHFVAVQRDVTARVEAERRIAQAQQAARESDRKKANLARYFSPAMVDVLAQRDHPLGPVRRQAAAVLFVDIVGFVGARACRRTASVVLPTDGKGGLRPTGLYRKVLGRCAHGALWCAQSCRTGGD
jgi:PAS domain S-box-containing protein